MDKHNFHVLSHSTLDSLAEQIEQHLSDDFEVEYVEGVLTISHDSEQEFFINAHDATQQIWLSSPLSGATHFTYNEEKGCWNSTKDSQVTLRQLLAEELSRLSNRIFVFDPV